MSNLGFMGITLIEILTIVFLIITLIFLCKNMTKTCICLISMLLFLNLLGNWNAYFNIYILIRNSLVK